MACPAIAGAAEDEELQEILVTGERQARTLARTASSAAVTSADELHWLSGADRLDHVLSMVPNIVASGGSEAPAIRGQDATGPLRDLPGFLGGARPRGTLQVDGRAVGFNEFVFAAAPLWDVARVEVFRSPQTTTQGRNAIAGGIFIHTQDPTPEWEANLRLVGGDQHTRQGSLAVAGPLGQSGLGVRLAGDVRRGRTSNRAADLFDGADPNRDDYASVRVKLLAQPGGAANLRVLTTYAHSESDSPQIEGIAPPFQQRVNPNPGYGVFATDTDSLTIDARYRLAPAATGTTVLSMGDALTVRHARQIGTAGRLGQTRTRARDITLENLFEWETHAALRWTAGTHLVRTRIDQRIDLSAVLGAGAFGDTQASLGVFGQVEVQPLNHWSIAAGVRHQRDRQDREGELVGQGTAYLVDYRETFVATLPKLTITWSPRAGLAAGVLVQRASNPGGVSFDFATGSQAAFAAEKLWNKELFARLTRGPASLRANLFHNTFRDAQRAVNRVLFLPGTPPVVWAEIRNVPRASSHGLELDAHWKISRRVHLRAAAGWLDTQIEERQFQRAPGFSATAGLDVLPVSGWRLSIQARHHSGYFSDDANTAGLRVDASTLVDARAGYDAGWWSAFAYGRNLFDAFQITRYYNNALATAEDPREVGVGVELRLR